MSCLWRRYIVALMHEKDLKHEIKSVVEQATLFLNDDEVQEVYKRRRPSKMLLERVLGHLQKVPDGVFDKYNINWDFQQNSRGSGNVVNTMKAIIPWDRSEDFVQGRETM